MRLAAVGALVGAPGWTVSSVVAVGYGVEPPYGTVGSFPWRLIESFDAIAEVGMLVALVGLHVRQADAYGWVGRTGFGLTAAGAASLAISTVVWLSDPTGGSAIVDVFFVGGILATVIGYPILGYGTYRAKQFPRWLGALLGSYTGFVVLALYLTEFNGGARVLMGLPWLGVGYALRVEANSPGERAGNPR